MFVMSKETEEEKNLKRKRVSSLATVFSRALSVLTSRKINVYVVDEAGNKSPAWSSTHEVWLNLAELKDDFTSRSIASYNGVAFHELGHLRYTPRNGSEIVGLIRNDADSRRLWSSFNCLEDARIENLLVAYLPSIESWLVATITDYLLDNPDSFDKVFPLVYGRYYLPKEVRQLASDKYMKRDDLTELASIIDEYTTINHATADATRTFELIKKFADLLDNLPPCEQPTGEGNDEEGCVIVRVRNPHGHDYRPTQGYESSSHRPASSQQIKEELEKVKQQRGKVVIEIDLTKEDTDDSFDDDDSTNQSEQPAPKTPTPQAPKEKSDFDSDDDLDFDSDDSDDSPQKNNDSSKSDSWGDEAGDTGANSQVTDTLKDILDDVLDNLSQDINQIAKQMGITDLDAGNAQQPPKAKYRSVNVPPQLVDISRAFGRELERLRAEHEPQWIRYQDSGRVNAYRYLKGDDYDSIFDEYSEGREDVTEIEAVILLDKSGSMEGDNADNAYKSMWAIKNALERVNARTTVLLFDFNSTILYGADEKAGTTIRDAGADGGTNPEHALLYAKRVLAETEKPIRLLFMITDGQWNSDKGEQAVREMRDAGVLTCQSLITSYTPQDYDYAEYRHSFELISVIKTAKDILTLGKELVRIAIKRNLVVNA